MTQPKRADSHDCCCEPADGSALPGYEIGRRAFLLSSLGMLVTGCASTQELTSLPGPYWPSRSLPVEEASAPVKPVNPQAIPALSRSQWAGGDPDGSQLNPMLPIQHITVHHDGMEPFFSLDQNNSAARLELIRRSHRNKGWADIGYHFAVDRQGRVWEGRSLRFQGAHVKDRNEGNIGVVTLGNFDRQSPSQLQLQSLNRTIGQLMARFKVPLRNVKTHQEWPGAATACPGTNLQRYMVTMRNNRQIG